MKVFTDSEGRICDVLTNTTGREDLTEVEITDGTFDGWSKGKMMCYKVNVVNGSVHMLTPCVDSRIIRNLDGTQPIKLEKRSYIDDTECIFSGVPAGNVSVYVDGLNYERFARDGDKITVSFEPLEKVTNITVTII